MSAEPVDRGRQASTVSNGITRLHREHYGRGATSAQTIIQRNYVVCFLEDIYTPVERTLIESGRLDAVRETRNIFQDAMGPRFREAVETATGRKVVAFMSQVGWTVDRAPRPGTLQPASKITRANSGNEKPGRIMP